MKLILRTDLDKLERKLEIFTSADSTDYDADESNYPVSEVIEWPSDKPLEEGDKLINVYFDAGGNGLNLNTLHPTRVDPAYSGDLYTHIRYAKDGVYVAAYGIFPKPNAMNGRAIFPECRIMDYEYEVIKIQTDKSGHEFINEFISGVLNEEDGRSLDNRDVIF